MRRVLKISVCGLLVVGVLRGYLHYDQLHGDTAVIRLARAVIDTSEDLTYRWIGPLLGFITNLIDSLTGTGK